MIYRLVDKLEEAESNVSLSKNEASYIAELLRYLEYYWFHAHLTNDFNPTKDHEAVIALEKEYEKMRFKVPKEFSHLEDENKDE